MKQLEFFCRGRAVLLVAIALFPAARVSSQEPGLTLVEWRCFAPAWTNVLTKITTADVALVTGPTASAYWADPNCTPITFRSNWPNSNRLQIELGEPNACIPETAYGSALVIGFAPLAEGDWELCSESLEISYTFHVFPADDPPAVSAKISEDHVTLIWPTVVDRSYNVERTTDFRTWSSVYGVNGTGDDQTVAFPAEPGPAFYRVRVYPRTNDLPGYTYSCQPPRP
jgi:hypothetical protein